MASMPSSVDMQTVVAADRGRPDFAGHSSGSLVSSAD